MLALSGCAGTSTLTVSSSGSVGLAKLAVKLHELHKQVSCSRGVVQEERSASVYTSVSTDRPRDISAQVYGRAVCP